MLKSMCNGLKCDRKPQISGILTEPLNPRGLCNGSWTEYAVLWGGCKNIDRVIFGWYVGDIWMIFGWYVGDIWMICLIYGWYLDDMCNIWMIFGLYV